MATALCTPNAPWPLANLAGARSIETPFSTRTLPVEHREPGSHTVRRADYPEGVVIIPAGHDPEGSPSVLPAVVTAEDECSLTLDPEDLEDYGGGVTVVFVG